MEDSSFVLLFKRERTLHQILGGGFVAEVILWRRRNITIGILVMPLAAWALFEKSGYTLLSLVANVVLLLIVILFLWAKSAAILNRPPPPLPKLQLSEDIVNEVAAYVSSHVNNLLSVSYDIALAKYPRLFFKIALVLWTISIIGRWTDFFTLAYTTLFVLLTVPALFEKYEDHIDKYMAMAYTVLRHLYMRLDEKCLSVVRELILEKKKLR